MGLPLTWVAVVLIVEVPSRLSMMDGALFTREATFLSGTTVLGDCVTSEEDFLLDVGELALNLRCWCSKTRSTFAGVTLASMVAMAVDAGGGERDPFGERRELVLPNARRANSL